MLGVLYAWRTLSQRKQRASLHLDQIEQKNLRRLVTAYAQDAFVANRSAIAARVLPRSDQLRRAPPATKHAA